MSTLNYFDDETFNYMIDIMTKYPLWNNFLLNNSKNGGRFLKRAIDQTFFYLPEIERSHNKKKLNVFQILKAYRSGMILPLSNETASFPVVK